MSDVYGALLTRDRKGRSQFTKKTLKNLKEINIQVDKVIKGNRKTLQRKLVKKFNQNRCNDYRSGKLKC